jgi:hypothetical protein
MGIKIERKGDIILELHTRVKDMTKDLVQHLKEGTPYKSGDAHDGWSISSNAGKGRGVIKNKVKYVKYLDAGGHNGPSKPHAPDGITKPAQKKLQKDIRAGKYKQSKRT